MFFFLFLEIVGQVKHKNSLGEIFNRKKAFCFFDRNSNHRNQVLT